MDVMLFKEGKRKQRKRGERGGGEERGGEGRKSWMYLIRDKIIIIKKRSWRELEEDLDVLGLKERGREGKGGKRRRKKGLRGQRDS